MTTLQKVGFVVFVDFADFPAALWHVPGLGLPPPPFSLLDTRGGALLPCVLESSTLRPVTKRWRNDRAAARSSV